MVATTLVRSVLYSQTSQIDYRLLWVRETVTTAVHYYSYTERLTTTKKAKTHRITMIFQCSFIHSMHLALNLTSSRFDCRIRTKHHPLKWHYNYIIQRIYLIPHSCADLQSLRIPTVLIVPTAHFLAILYHHTINHHHHMYRSPVFPSLPPPPPPLPTLTQASYSYVVQLLYW